MLSRLHGMRTLHVTGGTRSQKGRFFLRDNRDSEDLLEVISAPLWFANEFANGMLDHGTRCNSDD